jgi:predicted 3-demethylubiquinone-9 3-methyltransferase (glyoxalase superfamily)
MATRRTTRGPAAKVAVSGITPFLWFDGAAEEAARFYVSLFRGSRVDEVNRMPDPAGKGPDRVLTVAFTLAGQKFFALNGGPGFTPNPSFSFYVDCPSQAAVDRLWRGLLRGGKPSQCGWLQDRYGFSWQIIPSRLGELLMDPDPGRARRAMAAMMKMVKIDVAALERAADGRD